MMCPDEFRPPEMSGFDQEALEIGMMRNTEI